MGDRCIVYYRISSSKEEESGRGLESQKAAVRKYLQDKNGEIVGEYRETAHGKAEVWRELAKAIEECNTKGAKLVVSQLKRLSRDVHLITGLKESDIDFVIAENPEISSRNIRLLAVIAEHERKIQSSINKAGFSAGKAKGKRYGHRCFRKGKQIPGSGDTTAARKARSLKADLFAQKMARVIEKNGYSGSLRQIAASLNADRYLTATGKSWTAIAVSRVKRRAGI